MAPRPKRTRRPRPGGPVARTAGSGLDAFVTDPETGEPAELRRLQPYQATKTYVCPGCNQEIRPGTGHVVVVPLNDVSFRRHWHAPCWEHRAHRRPTGR